MAREEAVRTDTAIVVMRDNKIVRVTADELRKESVMLDRLAVELNAVISRNQQCGIFLVTLGPECDCRIVMLRRQGRILPEQSGHF